MKNTRAELQADMYKTLSHPTRVEILNLLRSGEKCVCEIFSELNLKQANASRHLTAMKNAGILSSNKEGLKVMFKVKNDRIFVLLDLTAELLTINLQELKSALELLKDKKPINF